MFAYQPADFTLKASVQVLLYCVAEGEKQIETFTKSMNIYCSTLWYVFRDTRSRNISLGAIGTYIVTYVSVTYVSFRHVFVRYQQINIWLSFLDKCYLIIGSICTIYNHNLGFECIIRPQKGMVTYVLTKNYAPTLRKTKNSYKFISKITIQTLIF